MHAAAGVRARRFSLRRCRGSCHNAARDPRRTLELPPLPPHRGGAALVILLAGNLPYMYARMFSNFQPYDDEGYLLLTTRDFIDGGGLYSEILTGYGPFYYFYEYACFGGNAHAVTHERNRLVTLAEWGAGTILSAAVVLTFTGSISVSSIAMVALIPSVTALSNEPGHPQGLLLTLVAAILLLAPRLVEDDEKAWPWLLAGAFVAAAGLSKVNSGAFVAAGLAIPIVQRLEVPMRALASRIVKVAACAFPLLLMHAHFASWAAPYCVAATAAIAGIVIVMHAPPAERIALRRVALAIAAAALVTAATLAGLVLRGTATRDALTGWIRIPAGLASAFQVLPPDWYTAIPNAILSLVLAIVYRLLPSSARARLAPLITVLKLALAAYTLFLGVVDLGGRLPYVAPYLWLVVTPSPGREWSFEQRFTREVIALVAAMQTLMAYPVAGSQLQMSTFLILPAALVCGADAIDTLRDRVHLPARRIAIAVSSIVLGALLLYVSARRNNVAVSEYRASTPLNLPGAARLRINYEDAAEYQWIAANLRAQCDRFASLPGVGSLSLWSGVAPLTRSHAQYLWSGLMPLSETGGGRWLRDVTREQQNEMTARLLERNRSCVVVGSAFHATLGPAQQFTNPLLDAVDREFVPSGLRTPSTSILERRTRAPLENYLVAGTHEFDDHDDRLAAPNAVFRPDEFTIEMWFRTVRGGMLLSLQDRVTIAPRCHGPVVYVGNDGHVYAGARTGLEKPALRSSRPFADGRWHRLVLTEDGGMETLHVDDDVVREEVPLRPCAGLLHCMIGSGYASKYPAADEGWFDFHGSIASVIHHARPLDDADVAARRTAAPPR